MHRTVRGALLWGALFCFTLNAAQAEICTASTYGNENGQTRRADGKHFNPAEIIFAHRTRPLGSIIRVTVGSRSVIGRVLDRGPFVQHGRCLDMSFGAAAALGLPRRWLGKVTIE